LEQNPKAHVWIATMTKWHFACIMSCKHS
jgi:hypothetical protein